MSVDSGPPSVEMDSTARRDMSRFAGSYTFTMAADGLRMLLGTALLAMLTRQLGKAGYGSLQLAYLAVSVLGLASRWPIYAVVRFGRPEYDQTRGVSETMSSCMGLAAGGIVVSNLLAWAFHRQIQAFIGCDGLTLAVIVSYQSLAVLYSIATQTQRAAGAFRLYALFDPFFQLVLCAGVALLSLLGALDLRGAILAYCAASGASLLAALWLARVRQGLRFRPSRKRMAEAALYASPLLLAGMTTLASRLIDQSVIRVVLKSTAQVGVFGLAMTIYENVCSAPQTFAHLLFPILVSLRFAGTERMDAGRVSYYVRRLLYHFWVPYLLLLECLAISAREIIWILSGQEYADSMAPLMWLLPGAVVLGVRAMLSPIFVTYDMVRQVTVITVMNCALNAALDLAFIGPFGIAGVAMSTFLVMVFELAACLWLLRRRFGILDLRPLLPGALFALTVAIAMFVPALGPRLGLWGAKMALTCFVIRRLGLLRREDEGLGDRFGLPAPAARLYRLWVRIWTPRAQSSA